jgi:hypothetical protein
MSDKKKKAKRIRKIILTILFIAINAIVITITATSEFGNSNGAAELSEIKINWWYLLPATLCFVGMIILEVAKYVLMIRRTAGRTDIKKSAAWSLAWRTVMLGRYYDRVTPAAVGGQPFQIYHMRKSGMVSRGMASAIPVFGMISGQIAFILIAIPCFIAGGFSGENSVLILTAWLGLLFYAFWPILVASASFFPKPTTRLIKAFVKLLAKKNHQESRGCSF